MLTGSSSFMLSKEYLDLYVVLAKQVMEAVLDTGKASDQDDVWFTKL